MIYTFEAKGLQKTDHGLNYAVVHRLPRELKRQFTKPAYVWADDVMIDGKLFLSIEIIETKAGPEAAASNQERASFLYTDIGDGLGISYDAEDTWVAIVDNDPCEPQAVTLSYDQIDAVVERLQAAKKTIEGQAESEFKVDTTAE